MYSGPGTAGRFLRAELVEEDGGLKLGGMTERRHRRGPNQMGGVYLDRRCTQCGILDKSK